MACNSSLAAFLHDSLHFNVIAFESGLYDVFYANELIAENAGLDARAYLDNSLFPIWTAAAEFQPFLRYMDRSKGSLAVAGFDCQLSGKYPGLYLVDSLSACLRRAGIPAIPDPDLLGEVIASLNETNSFPDDVNYNKFDKNINAIISILIRLAEKKAVSPRDTRLVLLYGQVLKNLKGLAQDSQQKKGRVLNDSTFKASDSNLRDSLMAESLLTLMKLYPGEKFICWGGGTHFIYDTRNMGNAELRSYRSMGMRVKAAIGSGRVLDLAYIASGGSHGLIGGEGKSVPPPPAGSLENELSSQEPGAEARVIDLHSKEFEGRKFVSAVLEYRPLQANWSSLFDGFIYLKTFSPVTALYFDHRQADPNDTAAGVNATASVRLSGEVIDDSTKLPVSYASVQARQVSLGAICNNKGEFNVLISGTGVDTLWVTAIGYASKAVAIQPDERPRIGLAKQSQTLDAVAVVARKTNPLQIVRNAAANFDRNYGKGPYYQYGYISSRASNDSVTFFDEDFMADVYQLEMETVPKADFLQRNVNLLDHNMLKTVGVFNNMPYDVIQLDLVRNGMFLPASAYKGYTFRLERTYADNLLGTVYLLSFDANKKDYRHTGDYFTASMEGHLLIRKQDYAIVSAEYHLVRRVDKLQKWSDRLYRSAEGSGKFWNKRPSGTAVEGYCSYSKDSITGKYVVRYANRVFLESGTLKPDNRSFSLVSDLTFLSLGPAVDVPDPGRLPFTRFHRWEDVRSGGEFWKSFVIPALNRYDRPGNEKEESKK